MSESARVIVLGIGNPERGDDGAGRAVARALERRSPDGVEVVEHGGEAAGLLDALEGAAAAFIVDACVTGAAAGSVRRLDVVAAPLPAARFGASTHGLGLAEALELGRALSRLPPRCVVYAIEGTCFDPGAPLSPPVAAAVDTVAGRIRAELLELASAWISGPD